MRSEFFVGLEDDTQVSSNDSKAVNRSKTPLSHLQNKTKSFISDPDTNWAIHGRLHGTGASLSSYQTVQTVGGITSVFEGLC